MRILLFYHYFHPDKCVSARIFSDLAQELSNKGNTVSVFTSNRLLRENDHLKNFEKWNDVTIYRFSHPNFNQGNNFGRLLNSIILQTKWILGYWKHKKEFDAMIVGTDPQFSYLMFPLLKSINRKTKLIHWVFDLYPEAILVNSPSWMKILAMTMKTFASFSYKFVDEMVDIGSCMRERLRHYRNLARHDTLPPWALKEPSNVLTPDAATRDELFRSAKIGLLYSGTVGYAHDIRPFISLARECRNNRIDAAFCFAGYGNCYKEQTSIISEEDTNIRVVGFASEDELEKRLSAADIHLVSLRKGWEGIVVPSKFFGSLAIGRPVIFSGPKESEISRWCNKYNIGLHLSNDTLDFLRQIEKNELNIDQMKKEAFEIYQKDFSKTVICEKWNHILSSLL